MEQQPVLVSACLLGLSCKYSGGSNRCPALESWLRAHGCTPIPFCPEIYGGLPTPRPPAERRGDRVVTAAGADVTAQFARGAEQALLLTQTMGCRFAVLKANSPSCGCGTVYDGSFSGRKIPGNGLTAELLLQAGITAATEENFERLFG